MAAPDQSLKFPPPNYNRLCFLKNIITNFNIIVGDYTYYDGFENVQNFEKNVKHHFNFIGDKLIIGKFCMIASDVIFIMNGANHLTSAITSYPSAILGEDWKNATAGKTYPFKSDTCIGNDVWIGYKAVIMPGIKIGGGAIIATDSTVTKDVLTYTIIGGNPAKEIRKRFSNKQIKDLLMMKWWDWDIEQITKNIEILTSSNIALFKAL